MSFSACAFPRDRERESVCGTCVHYQHLHHHMRRGLLNGDAAKVSISIRIIAAITNSGRKGRDESDHLYAALPALCLWSSQQHQQPWRRLRPNMRFLVSRFSLLLASPRGGSTGPREEPPIHYLRARVISPAVSAQYLGRRDLAIK